jgi:hypothetical protein
VTGVAHVSEVVHATDGSANTFSIGELVLPAISS